MGVGGAYEFPFGKVKYTLAFHGLIYEIRKVQVINTGNPGGG